ncbi:MAG: flagellar hook protein FlgE [Spirochaetales bacterium]|nr:flagellar hook protein FlgE [Spirochaetales bacterium]
MMRSLYAGVSGLQGHQTRMDVIGNNVANVNTTGFKRGRVNFQDMLSQNISGSSRAREEIGGINPKQVGLGTTIASIDVIHTQGSLQTTGVTTDVALMGEGFFVIKKGDQTFFTRAGNFAVDETGTLTTSNGMRVQGWQAREVNGQVVINTASDVEDLFIPVGGKDAAKETSRVRLQCNLNKNDTDWTLSKKIYDATGEVHNVRVDFAKSEEVTNQWAVTVAVDPEADAGAVGAVAGDEAAGNATNTFLVNFDNNGRLVSYTDAQGNTVAEGDLSIPVGFNLLNSVPDEEGNPARQTFSLELGRVGSTNETITQFADKPSTKAFYQDGYSLGYLESFSIDQSGIITGNFSNGNKRALGQLALASFVNNGGLEKAGENAYVESNNSGNANIGPSGIAGKGKMVSGALEMSNVDLATEFTDMIVTQRGFQANSRTITTSDQMLQELLSLKR